MDQQYFVGNVGSHRPPCAFPTGLRHELDGDTVQSAALHDHTIPALGSLLWSIDNDESLIFVDLDLQSFIKFQEVFTLGDSGPRSEDCVLSNASCLPVVAQWCS